jgi:hypothetical protein
MMAEGDGLRSLQVGETRHHGGRVGERLVGECALPGGERCVNLIDGVSHPQFKIGRNLVIARARGMQPARRRADQFGQSRLDVHMDVFERALEIEAAALDF